MIKTIQKKLLPVILTLAMVVSLLPAVTLQASATDTPDKSYETTAGTILTMDMNDLSGIADLDPDSQYILFTQPKDADDHTATLKYYNDNDGTWCDTAPYNNSNHDGYSGELYPCNDGDLGTIRFQASDVGVYTFLTSITDDDHYSTSLTSTCIIQVTVTGGNTVPTVTTQAVGDITSTTATGNGNITALGSANPTQHGFVWSTSANPTTADSKTEQGAASATGAFTGSITGLAAGTTYHVRAYATNDGGTSYGTEVTFTTSAVAADVTTSISGTLTKDNSFYRPNLDSAGGIITDTFVGPEVDSSYLSDPGAIYQTKDDLYNYFTVNFTPAVTGNYTFTVTSASLEPAASDHGYGTDTGAADDTAMFIYLASKFDPDGAIINIKGSDQAGGVSAASGPLKGLMYGEDSITSSGDLYSDLNNFRSQIASGTATKAPSPNNTVSQFIAGTTYTLVLTSYEYGVTGSINVDITGPGSVTVSSNNHTSGYATAPTDISLSSSSVDENTASGTAVGTLSTTDANAGDTFTYTLVSGTGDTDNASFTIDGSSLKLAVSPDYETKSNYSVRIQTEDAAGETYSKAFSITITDVNEAPTDIVLSNSSVNEGTASGTAVGTLSATDADSGDSATFTLVSGIGDTDNGIFTIEGTSLKIGFVPDYDTKNSYSVRVRCTDGGSLTYEEAFMISITMVNETPTDISLSSSSVDENTASGTAVGTLSTTDANAGDTFTYTLASGTGDTDNESFTIDGTSLKLAVTPDYETKSNYSVRIQTEDAAGEMYSKAFSITITDVNEAPTDIALSNSSVNEGTASGTAVGTLSATDTDSGDSATFTLVSGIGDTDNGSFTIEGTSLKLGFVPDYDTKNSYSVRVRCTDSGGLTYDETFTITITMVNEAPTDISLSSNSVAENTASGTTVGTLLTMDANAGDTFTYTLVSGTGDTDNESFTIDGTSLKLAVTPDYETKNSYSVRIQTTDAAGATYSEAFTIGVTDVREATAENSTVTVSPATVPADGTATSTITVTLKDKNNDPVVGRAVTLAQGTGSSTISAASMVSDAGGVVTFTVKSTKAETVAYTATDTTDSITLTQTATVTFTEPTYTATINTKIDGTATDMASVVLKNDTSTFVTSKTATGVYTAAATNGTYNVYVNGIYTGVDITLNSSAASIMVNYHTVTFNSQGGSSIDTQTVLSGGKAIIPAAPTKSGSTFDGWYTDTGIAWNFSTDTISTAMTLCAKWTPVLTYRVTYIGNSNTSGIVPVDTNSYTSGAMATVKSNTGSLAKSGNTFVGWSDGTTTYTAGQTFTITGDITLTAVWSAVASIYTVTYSNNYTSGGTYATQNSISSGATLTSPGAPTRSGHTFIGWYKEAVCVNPWNFSVDTITANTTLYAKWSENTYLVSGTVKDDATPTPITVSDATVRVMQGNVLFGETITTSDGTFTVTGMPNGIYNLVISKGSQEITIRITVNGDICPVGIITLPSGNRNSTLEVNGSGTPNVVVDSLNDVFGNGTSPNSVYKQEDINNVNNGGTVEVKLTVQKNDASTDKTEVEATMTSGGYTTGMVLDVDMTKTVTTSSGASSSETITKLDDPITLIIPLPVELQGKTSYVVNRAHDYNDGNGIIVDSITTTANEAGEKIVINSEKTQLTLYVKYFSTYAIGYTTTSGSTGSTGSTGSGSTTSYTVTVTSGAGGSISPSSSKVMKGGSKTFTITADEGYHISDVLVDGESVGAVGSYTFSNVSAAHTIKAVFTKETTGWTNPFDDVNESDWFYDEVKYVAETGLMNGTSGTSFEPNLSTTRGMIVTILWRLENKPEAADSSSFSDVPTDEYYTEAVAWAEANGIVLGYDANTFGPDDTITREQMAAILYRYAQYKDYDTTQGGMTIREFDDYDSISDYALSALGWAVNAGLMQGNDKQLTPTCGATRAQIATILMRFCKNITN